MILNESSVIIKNNSHEELLIDLSAKTIKILLGRNIKRDTSMARTVIMLLFQNNMIMKVL